MMKKAELTFQVIIIAIISLIVLVVVISIFGSMMGKNNETVNTCSFRGGTCMSEAACRDQNGKALSNGETYCRNEHADGICCLGLLM